MAAPVSFNIETVKQKFNELIEFVKLLAQKPTDVIDVPDNEILQNFSSQATRETADSVARRELVAKLISSGIGLAASIALTYFAVNYMTNAMDPTRKEKQKSRERAEAMLRQLGVKDVKLTDYELCIAANLVDPLSMTVSWEDIGGLEETIEQIQDMVIFPFRRRDLFPRSRLVQPPKGVLLYGPPGCGKTMIAKATAKAAGARFINLQVSSLVDKWYGESQKRAEAVFSLALKLQPSIIFIDEIDSFLRVRSSNDHEATLMIKTQFMSFWDGLITDPSCQVIIMGATNRPQDVDAAILRRMPCTFKIGMPGRQQRRGILSLLMEDEEVDADIDYSRLGDITEGFSGSDLKEACRVAALNRVHSYVSAARSQYGDNYCERIDGPMRNINVQDLEVGINKIRISKQTMTDSISNIQLD
ncbi:outer mitochondrial transmembrane helix translocase-like [Ruditapes philippinarum]|uniref:outer mitochondrial transmembrane helix translocase-like n=1 Tax=Ruditapes philippinarum TaxID=129788 RepID=UPI00295B9832|nr:outer mitochondrial transmembrane helix translocase-like [Ruditapes philippinarum]